MVDFLFELDIISLACLSSSHKHRGRKKEKQALELHHGDCINEMKKIKASSIDLVLTDPPYGITACKWDSVIPTEELWEQLKRITRANSAIVMTATQPFTTTLISSNRKMFKYCWTWHKNTKTGFLNAKKQPLRNVEDVLVFYKKQPLYNPQGTRKVDITCHRGKNTGAIYNKSHKKGTYKQTQTGYPGQVLEINSATKTVHPTQKPVELMEYLIKTYTNQGATVLDFTMGSGTTGVAAKKLKRNFIGIERDKDFFEIAKKRIEAT